MRIFFIGSPPVKAALQEALKDCAEIISNASGLKTAGAVDLCICEVSDTFGVTKIPADATVPVFIYINTRDKSILDMLKSHRISGILQPPVDRVSFMRKAGSIIKTARPASGSSTDFDKIKIKILAKAENIPMLPAFVHKLIALTSGDGATLEAISTEIKKDQGISSRVIRMVNSPFFGLRQQVNSIDRAIVLLGFHTLKNIALAASASSYYNKQFTMYNTNGPALWNHAYTVALIAEMLAEQLHIDADSMYLAGLFHDIGKTVMVDFLVQEVSSPEDERRQLGIDHAEVAWMIVQRWQLSEEICTAIRNHHNPDNTKPSLILYYANRFALAANVENGILLGENQALHLIMEEIASIFPLPDKTTMTKRLTDLFKAASEVQI